MSGIYLLQTREFIKTKENVLKVGRGGYVIGRVNQYPKDSNILLLIQCNNIIEIEREIIKLFTLNYKQRLDIGREYFEGDYNLMIPDILKIIYDLDNHFTRPKSCSNCSLIPISNTDLIPLRNNDFKPLFYDSDIHTTTPMTRMTKREKELRLQIEEVKKAKLELEIAKQLKNKKCLTNLEIAKQIKNKKNLTNYYNKREEINLRKRAEYKAKKAINSIIPDIEEFTPVITVAEILDEIEIL